MNTDPVFKEEQEVTLCAGEGVTLHAGEEVLPGGSADTRPLPDNSADALELNQSSKSTPSHSARSRETLPGKASPSSSNGSDRLTPMQVLRNIKKSLLAADSVLNYVIIAVLSLMIAATAAYFNSTASARGGITGAGTDYMPIAICAGLLTGATGESDAAYSMMVVSTNSDSVPGRDRALDLSAKYLKDRNVKRSMLTDCLGAFIQYQDKDSGKKDAMIARLKDVIPQQHQLREAIAWQQIRQQNLSQAILEMKESLKLLPESNAYDRREREKILCKLWLAGQKWNEVNSFEPGDQQNEFNNAYRGLDLELDKVDALFHANQLQAAQKLLGKREIDEWQDVYEEGLWQGRILLQQNKLAEARKQADDLMEKNRESSVRNAGKLLKSEVLIAESRLDSNTRSRQEKLNEARRLVKDCSNWQSVFGGLRLMQLSILAGQYKEALDTPALDQFERENSDAVRDRGLFFAYRAQCNLHLKTPSVAMEDVNRALKIDPSLMKALEVGIQVCKATNDTVRVNEFQTRLDRVKSNPRLQTEY